MNTRSIFWCLFQKHSLIFFPHLSRTSALRIHCAWNSWIWYFYLNNTLLLRRNLRNLICATLRPESRKLTSTILSISARTFRFVLKTAGTKVVTWSQRYSFRQAGFYYYTADHCRSNKSETWMARRTRWLYDREKWSHMTTVTSVSLGRSILVPFLTKYRFADDCSEWS